MAAIAPHEGPASLSGNHAAPDQEGALAHKLSVLMPVYNERGTVMEIIRRVRAAEFATEIIVVDDCSTDGTREILRQEVDGRLPGVRVLYHERNRGKGAAIRTAAGHISGDVVLIQDADLEYDPTDYAALLQPILAGVADVVYGSRFLGGPHRVLYFWHSVGNRFLTTLSDMLTNLNLTDIETCYKAFRAEAFLSVKIRQDRFGFEPEITAKLARRGFRFYEVPISYNGRSYAEGKKITWRDGLKALWCILRYGIAD